MNKGSVGGELLVMAANFSSFSADCFRTTPEIGTTRAPAPLLRDREQTRPPSAGTPVGGGGNTQPIHLPSDARGWEY